MVESNSERSRIWAEMERPARPSRAVQLWRSLGWDAAVLVAVGGLLFGLAGAVGY